MLKARIGEPMLHVELEQAESAGDAREALAGLGSVEPADPGSPTRVVLRTAAGKGAIAPVIRALDERGVVVESIEVESPTLDDVFAAVTGSQLEGAGARARRVSAAREGRVVLALGRRSLSLQFRRAQLLMPTFVLPLMLLAVIASGTSAAQGLRGFPDVASYLTFVVPGTIIQGALLAV